jgi:hypothetical protein
MKPIGGACGMHGEEERCRQGFGGVKEMIMII